MHIILLRWLVLLVVARYCAADLILSPDFGPVDGNFREQLKSFDLVCLSGIVMVALQFARQTNRRPRKDEQATLDQFVSQVNREATQELGAFGIVICTATVQDAVRAVCAKMPAFTSSTRVFGDSSRIPSTLADIAEHVGANETAYKSAMQALGMHPRSVEVLISRFADLVRQRRTAQAEDANQTAAGNLGRDALAAALNPFTASSNFFAAQGIQHKTASKDHANISCDGCGAATIIGVRYRCSQCANYDLCEVCILRYENNELNHGPAFPFGERHLFLRVFDPKLTDAPRADLHSRASSVHDGFCSGCAGQIIGFCYSCQLCQGVRLCESCEALGTKHDPTHPRTKSWSAGSGGGN